MGIKNGRTKRIYEEPTEFKRLRKSTVKDIESFQKKAQIASFPTAAKIIVDNGLKKKAKNLKPLPNSTETL